MEPLHPLCYLLPWWGSRPGEWSLGQLGHRPLTDTLSGERAWDPLGCVSQCQEWEGRLVWRPRRLELHCVQVLQIHISGHLGDCLLALHPQAWDLPLPLRAEQGLLSTEASSPGCGAWDSQPRKDPEANFTVKLFQHFLLDIYYSSVVCKILWRIWYDKSYLPFPPRIRSSSKSDQPTGQL